MSDDNVLRASFYLPEIYIFNPGSNGVKIFKQFATKYYQDHDTMWLTWEFKATYSSTSEFYNSVATEAKMSPLLRGKFTLGVTLNRMTNFLSSGLVQIKVCPSTLRLTSNQGP